MSLFDTIKKINDHGQEYWLARSLAKALEYADFGNFQTVIAKAKLACEKS
jgi:DNA-damage-inducible protein D